MSLQTINDTEALVIPCPAGRGGRWGYLLAEKKGAAAFVIDPAPDPGVFIDLIESQNFLLKGLISTRSDADMASAYEEMVSRYRVPILGHLTNPLADMHVSDGDECLLGTMPLHFYHTPGTGCDAICVRFGDRLFTGDTLLVGGIGPNLGLEMVLAHFDSLQRLIRLEDEIQIWPRQFFGTAMYSTLGYEKKSNPYLKDLEDIRFFPGLLEWEKAAQKRRNHEAR